MKELDLEILVRSHRLTTELDRKTALLASEYGLTFSQFMVLEALYSKGDMSITEVRKTILSSVGTISVIISNLEKNGFIHRKTLEEDRRVCMLSLTEDGLAIISELAPRNENMIVETMGHLTQDEKITLIELLTKLGGTL